MKVTKVMFVFFLLMSLVLPPVTVVGAAEIPEAAHLEEEVEGIENLNIPNQGFTEDSVDSEEEAEENFVEFEQSEEPEIELELEPNPDADAEDVEEVTPELLDEPIDKADHLIESEIPKAEKVEETHSEDSEETKEEPVQQVMERSLAETTTSRLGHLNNGKVRIYKDYTKQSAYTEAGSIYTNEVYYIKKQARFNNSLYYLISRNSSSVQGVVGWVKSTDMQTHPHVTVDKKAKTFYVKGTGSAYTKAWGGRKNYSFEKLSTLKNQKFVVNLTEKVGNEVWHRGVINGKTAWIQATHVTNTTPGAETTTSRLGHLNNGKVRIYKDYKKQSTYTEAGSIYTNEVYYIKKQARFNNSLYYLISRNSSSVQGVVGWIKSTDMQTHPHVTVDKKAKTFYIKGTGSAYTKAWGGRKNYSFEKLSTLKNQKFVVNLTEKVGNAVWHRGVINGKTAWIQATHLTNASPGTESTTSLLGHINNGKVRIYKEYANQASYTEAGSTHTNKVYYIKKQARFNNSLYYLISRNSSSVKGVVGWVKSTDLATHPHVSVDKKTKTFYVKGTGSAYTTAWGGKKDFAIENLSSLKSAEFKVSLTERVGNNTWYQGILDGKLVWLHSNLVTTKKESTISRLAHINNGNVKIAKTLGNSATAFNAGSAHTNMVYYVKKQAVINNETYYLLSRSPSSVNGLVGWANAKDLTTQAHVGVSKKAEIFYIEGSGSAYGKAWGGSKDIVFKQLNQFENQEFKVNLTEKVGNNVWYRGVLAGKSAWIHESNLRITKTYYTNYNTTYNAMVDMQVKNSTPQTDKYRNNKAYIRSSDVQSEQGAAITDNGVRLRTAPKFGDNIAAGVNKGTKVVILGEVTGDLHAGSNKWYKITYNNRTLYVHTSLVKKNTTIYKTKAKANVYEAQNVSSHIYATLAKGAEVSVVKTGGTWHEVQLSTWRNAKPADVAYYVNPDNNDPFQHLLLTSSTGVAASELNKFLADKGVLKGKGAAFIQGGKDNQINEVYLISHSVLETGRGTSQLATGIEVGKAKNGTLELVTDKNKNSLTAIKKVYNVFGIRAFDSCPQECGAKHAYEQGWDTVDKAIIGGAKFIGGDYIHNQYKQNTIYKMRWNPLNPYKQYATDIGWAAKQTTQIRNIYNGLKNPKIEFDIPRYK